MNHKHDWISLDETFEESLHENAVGSSHPTEADLLPKCKECLDPIKQSDALYTDGGYICDGCLEELRREVLPEW